jgi:hypothetical protein
MTTVAELIEKLKTLPLDAEVEVLGAKNYFGDNNIFAAVDLDFYKYDFTDSKFINCKHYGKIIFEISAIDIKNV